jgi:HEAT repeat protein
VALAALLATPVDAVAQSAEVVQDTASDSYEEAKELYEQGRRQIRRDNYRRAVEAFREVNEDYSDSEYAADALYWEAFALYKLEYADDLHRALDLLAEQERRFPDDYEDGDGEFLATRIRRLLAEAGDLESVEQLTREAEGYAAQERREAQARAREAEYLAHESRHRDHEADHHATEAQRRAREAERHEAERHAHDTGSHHREDDIRITAVEALLHMESERAIPILEDVLRQRDSTSSELRAKALFVLSQQHSPETVELMMDVARNDPDPDVRREAVFWMGQMPGAETLDFLAELVAEESDPEFLDQAIFALSQHDDERASAILRDLAADETRDSEIRGQAVFWLGQRSGPNSFEFLRDLYQDLEEPEIKERVIFAMSQNAGDREREWLLGVAGDATEPVEAREQAVFWLGQSGYLSITQLESLYDSMEESVLREKVIFSLSQMPNSEAVDLLIKIAREDPDPELRRHAVFWLGQTDDSKAEDFLIQLISEGGGQ